MGIIVARGPVCECQYDKKVCEAREAPSYQTPNYRRKKIRNSVNDAWRRIRTRSCDMVCELPSCKAPDPK